MNFKTAPETGSQIGQLPTNQVLPHFEKLELLSERDRVSGHCYNVQTECSESAKCDNACARRGRDSHLTLWEETTFPVL